MIRRIAVLDASACRHLGCPIEGPLKLPVHHSTIVLRGLRGSLIRPPLCRETPASRAVNVDIYNLGLDTVFNAVEVFSVEFVDTFLLGYAYIYIYIYGVSDV